MCKIICIFSLFSSLFGEDASIAKISEAMGHIIGKNLQQLGLDFDVNALVKGIKEEANGQESPLNEDQCIAAIATLQEEKIAQSASEELEQADTLSNGTYLPDENCTLSTPDSAKYR